MFLDEDEQNNYVVNFKDEYYDNLDLESLHLLFLDLLKDYY